MMSEIAYGMEREKRSADILMKLLRVVLNLQYVARSSKRSSVVRSTSAWDASAQAM